MERRADARSDKIDAPRGRQLSGYLALATCMPSIGCIGSIECPGGMCQLVFRPRVVVVVVVVVVGKGGRE
jgi:hypothetical protein